MKITSTPDKKPLTARQKRFAIEYLRKPVGGEAARNAGYSPKGADRAAVRCLADPRIAAIIEEGMEEIRSKAIIDRAWVLNKTVEVIERSSGKDPAYKYNPNAMLKGLHILAQHTDVGAYGGKKDGLPADGRATKATNVFNILVQKMQEEAKEAKAIDVK